MFSCSTAVGVLAQSEAGDEQKPTSSVLLPLLSPSLLLLLFFVLLQDKLSQEQQQQEEEVKQPDDGPGEKVPDLEEEDGDKTKELLERLKALEVILFPSADLG